MTSLFGLGLHSFVPPCLQQYKPFNPLQVGVLDWERGSERARERGRYSESKGSIRTRLLERVYMVAVAQTARSSMLLGMQTRRHDGTTAAQQAAVAVSLPNIAVYK